MVLELRYKINKKGAWFIKNPQNKKAQTFGIIFRQTKMFIKNSNEESRYI